MSTRPQRPLVQALASLNVLSRPTNPAILPIPPRTTGNNVPKSEHRTRRSWWPNVTRVDLRVAAASAYGEASSSSSRSPQGLAGSSAVPGEGVLKGIKMQMRRKKDVEKAGGLEGLLLARPAKHLTPFGKQLRSALYTELHRVRAAARQDALETNTAVNDAPPLPAGVLAGSRRGGGAGKSQSIPTGSGR